MREDEKNPFIPDEPSEKRSRESAGPEDPTSQQRLFKSRSESGSKSQQRQYRSQIPQYTSQIPRKQDEEDEDDDSQR